MGNTKLANPAPLGLMGFGMTTILLNLHNVGYFALDGIILAMGIFYGGIAQIFAGLLEYKKGNTFGLTAFTSYGSFWLTLVAILLMPKLGSMPGIGGLEATRKIARSTADVKIIMLTVHTENPLPAKVMQAGAAGYLSKGAAPQEVVSAIRSVYSGQRYIASDIAQQMALSQIEPEKTESPFASLSERELQIMLMITKGQKVNEISEQLNLSPKTVNSYRYRMFSKLNIHGDVELTHLAIRHGLCNAETLSSQ